MTEQEKFERYLISHNYKMSTAETYARSINLIHKDFSLFLYNLKLSLYEVVDTSELMKLYEELYSVPAIISQEKRQRNRKSNAFKRYIEYRKSEEFSFDDENELNLKEIQKSKTEGGKKVIISKIAERDKSLRKQAIHIHGTICFGCKFNFKKIYGELGENFIEIHHLKLLSSNEEEIITDPKIDLIPLCSNCHRMVHRKKNYVLSLQELKNAIKKATDSRLE